MTRLSRYRHKYLKCISKKLPGHTQLLNKNMNTVIRFLNLNSKDNEICNVFFIFNSSSVVDIGFWLNLNSYYLDCFKLQNNVKTQKLSKNLFIILRNTPHLLSLALIFYFFLLSSHLALFILVVIIYFFLKIFLLEITIGQYKY